MKRTFPIAYRRKANAPAATPAESTLAPEQNSNMEVVPGVERVLEVISSSPRNAAVRLDGKLVILVRPS
jgi:hypothetical protein